MDSVHFSHMGSNCTGVFTEVRGGETNKQKKTPQKKFPRPNPKKQILCSLLTEMTEVFGLPFSQMTVELYLSLRCRDSPPLMYSNHPYAPLIHNIH